MYMRTQALTISMTITCNYVHENTSTTNSMAMTCTCVHENTSTTISMTYGTVWLFAAFTRAPK